MLSNASLTIKFWAEAVSTLCYLINRGPHLGINLQIPYEVWFGKSANYSILRAFDCTVYYHVSDGKLEPQAKKRVFVGYEDGVKGYKILSPSESIIILSRNVIFDKTSMFNSTVKSVVVSENDSDDKQVETIELEAKHQDSVSENILSDSVPPETQSSTTNQHSIALNRARRIRVGPPKRYGFDDMVAYALQVAEEVNTHEPSTYREAVSCSESV